jgi:gamma-glutamylcyclotransferase (GGCT)/AIG2-like uncharacterized protein YtfP
LNPYVTNLLFVYGTLRRGFCRHHTLRRLRAKSAGRGTIRAKLFNLGEFPGARPSGLASALVVGELYALPEAGQAFRILDAVEGIRTHAPERSLFKRETVDITLADKRRVTAWVYFLNRGLRARRRIVSGDYAAA